MTLLILYMWLIGLISIYGIINFHDGSPWVAQDWLLLLSWPVSMPLLWVWELMGYNE